MSKIETINPATGKVLATYENVNSDEVSRKVKAGRQAFVKWKKLDVVERAEYMRRLGRVMRKNREEYASLVTEEMGKPIRQSLARSEEHTSELQSRQYLVCRLLLEKKHKTFLHLLFFHIYTTYITTA